MFEIQLFGRLEVRTRGIRLSGADFGGDRPRHLLALLALHGEMSTSELSELLHAPKKAIENDLSVLRDHLEPGAAARDSVIVGHRGRYALNPDRVRVDVARFDELVTVATGRTASRALPPLTAAAHLAEHPLLADERSSWAEAARELYRSKLLETLLEAAGHALTAGRSREALALADRAVEMDPAAERGWRVAMAAHRALGDRVAALRAYDRCRRELARSLGVEPSAPTRTLFLELLRADGAGTAVDGAVSAVLAAAREADRPASVAVLLRRAAELVA
jgi:DNA-binding SARP family transcriptional activator